MMLTVAEIVFLKNQAYIPTMARGSLGYIDLDPVAVTSIDLDAIVQVIQERKMNGNIILSIIEEESLPRWSSALTRFIGISESELTHWGVAYLITWLTNKAQLSISKADYPDAFVWDVNKEMSFLPDTDLRIIVQTILNDLASRGQ